VSIDQEALDRDGYLELPPILTPRQCEEIVAMWEEPARFRSTVDMARHRFGRGEYRYFSYPLPPLVAELRERLYVPLAETANRWGERLGQEERFPSTLSAYLERCHAHGQTRPTPLVLRYEIDGYNCLHQDVYGDLGFPLQVVLVLSEKGVDYEGGEFLLLEQRPRAQSIGHVIAPARGGGLVFPNRVRPVAGSRGWYRAAIRHGVSRLRAGRRWALGLIFHDAK
jgi:hypothetical protein